jgi:hypothetical protein
MKYFLTIVAASLIVLGVLIQGNKGAQSVQTVVTHARPVAKPATEGTVRPEQPAASATAFGI